MEQFAVNKRLYESAVFGVFLRENFSLGSDRADERSFIVGDKELSAHGCFGKISRNTVKESVKAGLVLC